MQISWTSFSQFITSLAFCLKRRITVYRKLQRISKTYHILGRADAPEVSILVLYNNLRCPFNFMFLVCLLVYTARVYSILPYNLWSRAERRSSRRLGKTWYALTIAELNMTSHENSGTKYEDIRFRTALLDTIREIGLSPTFTLYARHNSV